MFMRMRSLLGIAAVTLSTALVLCVPISAGAAAGVPRPDHVVIVIFENHQQPQVIGSPNAPYINSLAQGGANFTQSFAVTHPSQPNYLALFSGSTQGISNDSCPHTFTANNLGKQLLDSGLGF